MGTCESCIAPRWLATCRRSPDGSRASVSASGVLREQVAGQVALQAVDKKIAVGAQDEQGKQKDKRQH